MCTATDMALAAGICTGNGTKNLSIFRLYQNNYNNKFWLTKFSLHCWTYMCMLFCCCLHVQLLANGALSKL